LHIVHRVIVSIRSGKFLFHDWKSQGKVREFYYARPVGTLNITCHGTHISARELVVPMLRSGVTCSVMSLLTFDNIHSGLLNSDV